VSKSILCSGLERESQATSGDILQDIPKNSVSALYNEGSHIPTMVGFREES
jgi:hypothetical protein